MSETRVYLDHQASTPCDPRVIAAMRPYWDLAFANPHSGEHAAGREAEAAVEMARAQVAAALGANALEIIFTSGATEANNLAIKGATRQAARAGDARRRIVTVATEHPCVLGAVRDLADEGFEPVILPVEADGRLDPAALRAAVSGALLVSVMAANNETGVLHDLPTLAAIARAAGALFHTDAAQAVGKVALAARDADLISVSGHKLYGPKGIGALYVRRRPRVRLRPLFSGGGQERGLRSGTVAVPLAVGLGAACAIASAEQADEAPRIGGLRDRLQARLHAAMPDLIVNGSLGARLPGTLNVTLPHASVAEVLTACPWLAISSGSACASAAIVPSHVLSAMGVGRMAARRSLRTGIGRFTSADEIDRVSAALIAVDAAAAAVVADATAPRRAPGL